MIDINTIQFIKKYNIKGVLDIGANRGNYAKEMHSIFPSIKIFSIEANKECYSFLEKTIGNILMIF